MKQQVNTKRGARQKTITFPQIIMILLALLGILLLNLLLFFGLFYKNQGSTTIPPEGSAASGDIDGDTVPGLSENDPTGTDPSDDPNAGGSGDATGGDGRDAYKYSYNAQSFKSDLSSYEAYMNPAGDEYLLLVNVDNPLSENYVPEDLVNLSSTRDDGRDPQRMRQNAAKALEALFLEAEEDGILYSNNGIILSVTSAYRGYASQSSIFEGYVKQTMDTNPSLSRAEAEKEVMTYSCRPGTSEHQSGLCCDMHNFPSASVSNGMREQFAGSKAGQWLLENCAKFGFVLRFPADKMDVTGIEYESWHFRYVGRYHAMRMQELGLCLEEYVQTLS